MGFKANGYRLASRVSSACGVRIKTGGYARFVVVVVVTVFVSTHSASSICSLAAPRATVSSPSSHPTETVWLVLGRRGPVVGFVVSEVGANGLGDPSGVYFSGAICLCWADTARRLI